MVRTCKKCGYTGDRFGKNRRVCHECRKSQRDLVKEAVYRKSEGRREARRLHQQKYRENHRAKHNAMCSATRAKRLDSCIQLTDDQQWMIDEIYELSRLRSKATGVPHEVDHIIPLCGKAVRGFHAPWNLQVLTQYENRRKAANYGH
jgi:hypothetical protein